MPPDRRAELVTIMSAIRPAATLTMAKALAEADLRDVLGLIRVPTLLVHGEADTRSTRHVVNALHAAIPGSRLKVMPGLGHECFLESAGAFGALVRGFLRDVGG